MSRLRSWSPCAAYAILLAISISKGAAAADPEGLSPSAVPAPTRPRLDMDQHSYPRHQTWGIFLGTGWTRDDLDKIPVWDGKNGWINPFTGRPFKNAKAFAFGHDNPVVEGVRILTDHFEVHMLSSGKDLTGHRFDFALCHSNGCTKAIGLHKAGVIKVDHFLALGTDWTSKDFQPGELKGATLTFFTTKTDPIGKLPAPAWKRIGENTPGLAFRVPFEKLEEIPKGFGSMVTRGRADPDRFDVVVLSPPSGQAGSLTNPTRAHALFRSYFPAIEKWMKSQGTLQKSLEDRIQRAEATEQSKPARDSLRGLTPIGGQRPGIGAGGEDRGPVPSPLPANQRGGILADIPISADDFK